MSIIFRRITAPVVVSLVLAMGLQGCAGSTNIVQDMRYMSMDGAGLSPREQAELERTQRYAEMRVQAATAGLLVGLISGAIVGASADNTAAGAVIGGLGGAQLGYMVGAYVAHQNEVAEHRRGNLNAQLASATSAIQETRRAVEVNRSMVASERRKIARMNEQYAAGEITREQYEAEYDIMLTRKKIVEQAVAAAEADVTAVEYTVAAQKQQGHNTAPLEKKLVAMRHEVAALTSERDALIAAIGTVPDEVS